MGDCLDNANEEQLDSEKRAKILNTEKIRLSDDQIVSLFDAKLGLTVKSIKRLEPGGFVNGVYFVGTCSGDHVLRLARPADDQWIQGEKTKHEVACLRLLKSAGVSVPNVLCFSAQPDEFGFEYIVMNRVPGERLRDIVSTLSAPRLELLVRNVGAMIAKMRKAVQEPTICGFTLDDDGNPAVAPPIGTNGQGPYATYREYADGVVEAHFKALTLMADPVWDGLLEPLRSHYKRTSALLFDSADPEHKEAAPVFTHCDINGDNVIVDPVSLSVTLIDFEWAGMRPPDMEEFDALDDFVIEGNGGDDEDQLQGLSEDRVMALLVESGFAMPTSTETFAPIREFINVLGAMRFRKEWFGGNPEGLARFDQDCLADIRTMLEEEA